MCSPPCSSTVGFQPTPPRGRRHHALLGPGQRWEVSTHASAREATAPDPCVPVPSHVSTHASAREATKGMPRRLICALFQPTPPRGRRPRAAAGWVGAKLLFQPTPPRGRRPPTQERGARGCVFQPTPPRGRRPCIRFAAVRSRKFQPTPPRGRRRSPWACSLRSQRCFNPRLRAGGDARLQRPVGDDGRVSTHASAREATAVHPGHCQNHSYTQISANLDPNPRKREARRRGEIQTPRSRNDLWESRTSPGFHVRYRFAEPVRR